MTDDKNTLELIPLNPHECYEKGIIAYREFKQRVKLGLIDNIEELSDEIAEVNQLSAKAIEYFEYAIKFSKHNPDNYTIEIPYIKNQPLSINLPNNTLQTETLVIRVLVETKAYEKLGRLYWKLGKYDKAIEHLDKAINSGILSLSSKRKNLIFRGLANFYLKKYFEAVTDIILSETPELKEHYYMAFSKEKEEILHAIQRLHDEKDKANTLFQALFPNTFWGGIFYYKRGSKDCSLEKGKLEEISNKVAQIPNLIEHLSHNITSMEAINQLNSNPAYQAIKEHLLVKIPVFRSLLSSSSNEDTNLCKIM